MGIIERPSPNYNERASGAIDMLVLHYTGMISCEHALVRLCGPAAKVSAHYLIDEMGLVYRLVAEERRAWHAGVSSWAGARDINSRSIGIELVNPGHELGYRNFPVLQMQALAELAQEILARHPIPPHRVLGHSDVAPGRKQDPGELFDWEWLAGQGIGMWPAHSSHRPPPQPLPARGRGSGIADPRGCSPPSPQRGSRPGRGRGPAPAPPSVRSPCRNSRRCTGSSRAGSTPSGPASWAGPGPGTVHRGP